MALVCFVLALGHGTDCVTKDQTPGYVIPISTEFNHHSTRRREVNTETRHRRGTADENEPILGFTIDTDTLTVREQYAASLVYRLVLLIYTSPEVDAIDNITIVGSRATINVGGGSVVLGTASFGDKLITMYTKHIPNLDGFMIVLLHEVYHIMGFGTLASDGATSFTGRTNALTLVHDALQINHCVETFMNAPAGSILYTDTTRSHWNSSNATWENDLMLPYINWGSTAMSVCTVKTVLLSRPSWVDRVCTRHDDCHSGDKCLTLGRHLFKVCQKPPLPALRKPFDAPNAFAQFFLFSLFVGLFWIGILACLQRPYDVLQG